MMIDSHILTPNTQAILLLCSRLEQKYNSEPKPLNIHEYNTIARWLLQEGLTPGDLLESTLQKRLSSIKINNLDSERLTTLLGRGMMLSLSIEKWTSKGLWVISRADKQYPQLLRKNLHLKAPPIIYGVGNIELLNQGGLAIVGSRDIDEEAMEYTQRIVELCANQQMQVVSGGARGVDKISMLGCLSKGGTAIGVLADSLTKASVNRKYREAIKDGRLTLISIYHPDAGFSVGNAMGRNKYIYALADYALVVTSSVSKGGTWAGAVEALEKIKTTPVFVRQEGDIPKGNVKLLEQGAIAFPESPWYKPFQELLSEYANDNLLAKQQNLKIQSTVLPLLNIDTLIDESPIQETKTNIKQENTQKARNTINNIGQSEEQHSFPKNIYQAVLPLILASIKTPKTDKSLAEDLKVQIGQIRAWLKIAVGEGKVIKHKNPVTYEINQQN